jgi:hypothetical protein
VGKGLAMAANDDLSSLTVSEAVRQAAGIVDPADTNGLVGDFERWFEDDDDLASTVPNLDRRLAGAIDELDPDGAEPALAVAAAVAAYLATIPRHAPRDPDGVIEQALRLQFGDHLPESLAPWGQTPHREL